MNNTTFSRNRIIRNGLSFFLFLGFFSGNAQKRILDCLDNSPIPDVIITSEKGIFLGISNFEGEIVWEKPIEKDEELVFSHISYGNTKHTYSESQKNKSLLLCRKERRLKEVVVKPRDPSKEYVVLKGYFRSYQMHDDVPIYYADGICEYYIPLKGKGRTLVNTLQNRTYRNKKLVALEKEQQEMKKTGIEISLKYYGMPYILSKPSLKQLGKKVTSHKKGENYFFEFDGSTIGKATVDNPSQRVFLDIDDFRGRKKERNLFGYTAKIQNYSISEIHDSATFPLISNEFLASKKSYRKMLLKHKTESDFKKIEVVKQFYTSDLRFVNKEEIGEMTDFFSVNSESNVITNYWENIELLYLPPLISNALGRELEMY